MHLFCGKFLRALLGFSVLTAQIMEVHKDAAISALRVNAHEISMSLDHKDLAYTLYSEELIDEGMYEAVLDKNTGKTNDSRLRELIKHARNFIKPEFGDPTYFVRFVNAIEEISTAQAQSIAHQLKKSYNEELRNLPKQTQEGNCQFSIMLLSDKKAYLF